MCGFAGYISFDRIKSDEAVLNRMADSIAHRGPDSAGVWVDDSVGIGLCHRRLSIIDLSPAGHQPMVSTSKRYVIVFNGEIYNHLELRQHVCADGNDILYTGRSDTITLLACIDKWGLETTLKKATGMFSIALWDREEQALYLARDRLGEKPLYYGWQTGIFLFASELKALKHHPAFVGEINRNSLALQMRHNYIPAPHTIYNDIYKLMPGTIHVLRRRKASRKVVEDTLTYWSLKETATSSIENPFSGDDSEAITMLDTVLRKSVSQQMIADVPLGAFLSGGIDSSVILALMQAESSKPIKTFTIGFDEKGYNEAEHAKAVAMHLGTEHTELYVSHREALDVIPQLPMLYDEPFSDSSQIPTFLISKMTKQYVTVSISGDGGDELFGGYNRYLWASTIWHKIGGIPRSLRKFAVKGITCFSPDTLNSIFDRVSRYLPANYNVARPGDKAYKLAEVLDVANKEEIYWRLISHWKQPSSVVIGATEPMTVVSDNTDWPKLKDFEHRMMYLDAMSYLSDDILVKVDRAAMGVSLETRVPMLDHRVVEFAWALPLSMKIRNGQGKWLLRQLLYKYVPKKLIERPKMGFGVPIDTWLRGPLREWAEELLDESRIKQEGFFHPEPIRQKWKEHLSGHRNWQYHLWDVLMFQAWLENESHSTMQLQ